MRTYQCHRVQSVAHHLIIQSRGTYSFLPLHLIEYDVCVPKKFNTNSFLSKTAAEPTVEALHRSMVLLINFYITDD